MKLSLRLNQWLSGAVSPGLACSPASCAHPKAQASQVPASAQGAYYSSITNAIDRQDWGALRKLATPEMRATEYIQMWENCAKAGQPVYVGKLVSIEQDAELNGRRCVRYSFQFENRDGIPYPHLLQVLVSEQDGRPEVLDFWNWGW